MKTHWKKNKYIIKNDNGGDKERRRKKHREEEEEKTKDSNDLQQHKKAAESIIEGGGGCPDISLSSTTSCFCLALHILAATSPLGQRATKNKEGEGNVCIPV
jgi:hypothetical protein